MNLDLIYLSIVQLVVTWMLVGIVWFSQVVHYPLYKKIKEGFVEYERSHIRPLTSRINLTRTLNVQQRFQESPQFW